MPTGAGAKMSLSEAAAELVRAAEMEVNVATQKKLSSSLEALKESFDTKLNTIQQVVKQSSTNSDDKMTTVNQNIVNLTGKINTVNQNIVELNETMKHTQKMQSLAWALQNADIGSFSYYDPNSYSDKNSADLLRKVLLWFRRGHGCYIGDSMLQHSRYFNEQEKEESREKFRKELAAQIYSLTGANPRWQKETDGRYAIYYS